jgi:hypothetical protein
MKHLMLHQLTSSLSTLYKFMKKSPLNSTGLLDTYVNAKKTKFFGFAMEITKLYEFLNFYSQYKLSLLCVNIFGC